MIFAEEHDQPDDTGPQPPRSGPPVAPPTAGAMLAACAAEAGHLARALAGLDQAMSAALAGVARAPPELQRVDLLRQEAEGLAATLALVAAAGAPDAMLEPAQITRAVPLHGQHARLHDPPAAPDTS